MVNFREICFLHLLDMPSPYAQSIQSLNTCYALAEAGASVCLMVKCARPSALGNAEALASYGLRPHPRLKLEWLPDGNAIASLRARWHVWQSHKRGIFYARHLKLAIAAARFTRHPVVIELHGIEPATERAARIADGIVTLTSALRDRIRDLYGPAAPVEVIPDGFNPSIFSPVTGNAPPRLVYIGHFSRWKGVDVLIRSLTRLPGVPALVIGGSREADAAREEVRALAVREGVAERIEWVENIPQAEIPSRLRGGDIAVLPTTAQHGEELAASPLKLFEYMASGLPIVASDLPSIRDVIRNGENGILFENGSSDSLAGAVRRLIESPEDRVMLASNALRESARYTWDERARRILAFIDRISHPSGLRRDAAGSH